MPSRTTSRRSLLATALAVPTAAVGVPLLTASPAAATTTGVQVVVDWTAIALARASPRVRARPPRRGW